MEEHILLGNNYLRGTELWLMNRTVQGYAEVKRATETVGVEEFLRENLMLGDLWMSKHLGGGTL